jgi:hypothetical protein
LSGTSLSADVSPTNSTHVAETDVGPADGGVTTDRADDVPIDARQTDADLTHTILTKAAQTGLDPVASNTSGAGIISLDTPAQAEIEGNGNRRSRRKRATYEFADSARCKQHLSTSISHSGRESGSKLGGSWL